MHYGELSCYTDKDYAKLFPHVFAFCLDDHGKLSILFFTDNQTLVFRKYTNQTMYVDYVLEQDNVMSALLSGKIPDASPMAMTIRKDRIKLTIGTYHKLRYANGCLEPLYGPLTGKIEKVQLHRNYMSLGTPHIKYNIDNVCSNLRRLPDSSPFHAENRYFAMKMDDRGNVYHLVRCKGMQMFHIEFFSDAEYKDANTSPNRFTVINFYNQVHVANKKSLTYVYNGEGTIMNFVVIEGCEIIYITSDVKLGSSKRGIMNTIDIPPYIHIGLNTWKEKEKVCYMEYSVSGDIFYGFRGLRDVYKFGNILAPRAEFCYFGIADLILPEYARIIRKTVSVKKDKIEAINTRPCNLIRKEPVAFYRGILKRAATMMRTCSNPLFKIQQNHTDVMFEPSIWSRILWCYLLPQKKVYAYDDDEKEGRRHMALKLLQNFNIGNIYYLQLLFRDICSSFTHSLLAKHMTNFHSAYNTIFYAISLLSCGDVIINSIAEDDVDKRNKAKEWQLNIDPYQKLLFCVNFSKFREEMYEKDYVPIQSEKDFKENMGIDWDLALKQSGMHNNAWLELGSNWHYVFTVLDCKKIYCKKMKKRARS